jgi:hypothetical protein
MLHAITLSVVMQSDMMMIVAISVILLNVQMLNVVLLNVFLPSALSQPYLQMLANSKRTSLLWTCGD